MSNKKPKKSNLPVPVKPNSVSVFAAAHPFKTKRIDRTVIAGGTIAEILRDIGLAALVDSAADVRLFVDDLMIAPDCWAWWTPDAGQIISLRVLPTGGGSGKDVLRGVMMIAVLAMSVYAPFAASAMLGTNVGAFGGALIAAGVGLGGMLAVNALIPPALPSLSNQSGYAGGANPFISGTQNRANLYGPIPQIFGTHRIYPPLAAEPWTENFGSDSYLRMLFCVGTGEYDISDHLIGETDTSTFDDFEIQAWNTADGDPVTQLFPSDVHEAALSVQIEYLGGPVGGWYEQTTIAGIHEISLDITFPSGLWQQFDSGNVRAKSVTFEARYSVADAGSWTDFDSSPLTVDKKVMHRYSVGFRAGNLAANQYDVQIRRTTADEAGSGVDALNADSYWTVLRSITYVAPFALDNVTLIALRVRASGQLNGVIDRFSVIAAAKVPTYTASAWTANTATRNPAWAFAEVLRGDANLRALADARIDGDALESWADDCTDAGYYFDAIIDYKTTVFELLRKIAAAGRATFAIIDNKYSVVQDVLQTVPRQHFSPRNSWGFSGHKTFIDNPHAIRCRYVNSASDYRQDEIIVYDDGYDAESATVFETMDFYGVTTADHVWKLARYHMAVGILRPETFELYTDPEWITCVRGDMVRLTHDVLLVGLGQARIKVIDGLDVTLDASITMVGGSTYGAQIRKADGTMLDTTIATDAGEQTTVTLGSVTGAAVGDLVFFGETDAESIECIVSRIDPGPDLSAHLWLVPAAPAVHDADTGAIPDYDPVITLPPPDTRTPPTPTILSVTLSVSSSIDDHNLDVMLVAAVDFTVDTSNPNLLWPANFQAAYRMTDTGESDFIALPILADDERVFECPVENGATYDFRVRAVSEFGITSDWDTEADYLVDYTFTIPNDIANLALVQGGATWEGRDVALTWDEPADLYRVARYQLDVYKTDGTVFLRTKFIEVGGLFADYTFDENYEDNAGSPTGALTFRIWAVSPLDEHSANYDSLVVTHVAPIAVSSLVGTAYRGGVLFTWAHTITDAFDVFWVSMQVEDDEVSWHVQTQNYFSRPLTDAEVTEHGADATIYIIVYTRDIFGTLSAGSSANQDAGTLFVQPTDIDDFPALLSDLYLVPVVVGLTITNDTPDTDSITWNAHSLWYDGTEYEISGGSTSNTYVYFKDPNGVGGATTYVESDTHPADSGGEADWNTEEDFIIMVNDGGSGQAAWYAMANAVIGSAYIKSAAIQDLHVDNISGDKIIAGSLLLTGLADEVLYQMSHSYNLVKNGEFKKDAHNETNPENWSVTNTGSPTLTQVRRETGSHIPTWDVNNAMCFRGTCDDAAESVLLTSTDFIPVNHNLDYCLSAWVKGATDTRRFYLGLRYYDSSEVACSPTSYQWMGASDYSPAFSWHQVEGVCYNSGSAETNKFPSDCAYVKVRCYVQYQAVGGNCVSRIAFHEGLYPQRGVTVIDGGHIYTGSITADEIAANTITAAEIAANTITAAEIAANAITADEINTGAIVIDGLHGDVSYEMSSSYNLVKNGEFRKDTNGETTPEDWDTTIQGTPLYRRVWTPSPAATYGAPWDLNNALVYYARCDAGSEYVQLTSTDYIPIDEDKNYCLSCWVRGIDIDGTRDFSLGLLFFDSSYGACSPPYEFGTVQDISPATSWNQVQWVCYNSSSGEDNKFPSGCAYVKIDIWPQYDTIGANLFSRVAFQEGLYPSRGTTVIDGGYIYADTISANEINGTNFGTLTITSGKIAINTTDALEIQASGNMKLLTGADIQLYSATSGSTSLLEFHGDSRTFYMGIDYDNDYLCLYTDSNGLGDLLFGVNPSGANRQFNTIDMRADAAVDLYVGNTYLEILPSNLDLIVDTGGHITLNADTTLFQGSNARPYTDSSVLLGTSSYCWSNVYADAGITSCSDRKYKNDIAITPLGLDFINALMPIRYHFSKTGQRPKNHNREYHGLIATEVEQALIEVGYDPSQFGGIKKDKDEDGLEWYGLVYEQLIAPLIKAVQELAKEIEILKKVKS